MSETIRVTNTSVSSETGFLKRPWNSIHFFFAKRAFESKLARILRAAYGHEGNALPAGDRQYQLLNSQMDSICTEFADRWRIDRELLRAQLPGLAKLASLAIPPAKRNWASLAGLVIVAIPVTPPRKQRCSPLPRPNGATPVGNKC